MTTRLPITQVDAFADRPFTGNPAAVMPLNAWLPDDVLQAIAAENNLAETAFIVADSTGETDYELRWFTPEVEVALCGHATLASGHVLMKQGGVRFRTRRSGLLEVQPEGEGYALSLPNWAPHPRPLPELVPAMGGRPAETLWHEGGYAVFVYDNADAVLALKPDPGPLREAGNMLYIATAPGRETDIISRVFAPAAGIEEDPVTGSAHCVIAPYWAERLGRASFTAYQASARGGHLGCRVDSERVVLIGSCITVLEGSFLLP
jgi:predicted PhzF superfamily epimerase YddE/YHI9